jgi:ribosomal protein S14
MAAGVTDRLWSVEELIDAVTPRKAQHECARCGQPASIRIVEEVLDRYWERFQVPLCDACDESLRFCDGSAWKWFREYAGSVTDRTVLQTHLWAHTNPRRFKQEGKLIFLRQCSRCGRDFAKCLDGSD